MNIWRDEDYYEVGVYYPSMPQGFDHGYGLTLKCRTLGEAQERRESLIRQGHRNVHVRRVTARCESETITTVADVASLRRRG